MYSNDSTTIETHIFNKQNGNEIYFNYSKAQRINILMMLDKLVNAFFGILYKILFGCGKNNETKQTNQKTNRPHNPQSLHWGSELKVQSLFQNEIPPSYLAFLQLYWMKRKFRGKVLM